MRAQPYTFGGGEIVGVLFPIKAGLEGRPYPGLGDNTTGEATLIAGAGTAASAAANAISTAGQIGASVTAAADTAAAALLATGVGAPVAAVVAAVGNLLGPIIDKFSGCGSTCTQATAIANSIGTPMAQAFQAYMNAPVHYYSAQQSFLVLFNQLMTSLNNACSNPALGTAGKNCIADNSPTACQWKASPGGWSQNAAGQWTYTYWGAAGSGSACWNPYTGIYDEVLNDPTVVPDPVAGASTTPTAAGTTGSVSAAPGTVGASTDSASTWLTLAVVGILAAFILL
jgi:hypothetical protein